MKNLFFFNRFCFTKKNFFHKCDKPYLSNIQLFSFNNFLYHKKNAQFSILKILKKYFPLINIKRNIFLKVKKIIIKKPFNNIKYIKTKHLHYFSIINLLFCIYFINKNVKVIKKIELGKIPFMTNRGSFIINGTERVLISQFIKSNGIYFYTENNVKICKIIINNQWIDIIYKKQISFIFHKKLNFTINEFLLFIGIEKNIFFNFFFLNLKLKIIKGKKKIFFIFKKKFFINKIYNKHFCMSIKKIINFFYGKYYILDNNCFKKFKIIKLNNLNIFLNKKYYFLNLLINKYIFKKKFFIKIYKNFKQKINIDNFYFKKSNIFYLFNNIQKNKKTLNIKIGIKRIEARINFKYNHIFSYIKIILKTLNFIKFNLEDDNFDNIENKVILNSGNLLSNKFNFIIKNIIKRLKYQLKKITIRDTNFSLDVNFLTIEFKEYFCNNELSQYFDQNNPLSEISHTRKISIISGIGIKKENCGFDIRDIHYSQICKICPIDTPEGHNIGLIASLSFYSKVNKYNFISTIYKIIIFGNLIGIMFVDNKFEKTKNISTFSSIIKTVYGEIFKFPIIEIRRKSYYEKCKFFLIDLVEISGNQMISIAASLIPFFSYNDANRCLMGSNMQRQAVPLIKSENPLVGTGNELLIGNCAGYNILSEFYGYILYCDNFKIIIKTLFGIKKYYLEKYSRTNQNTVFHQNIKINIGYFIKRGELLADSLSTKNGEISLGKNLKVAYMSWYGYNFEDSIVLSDKVFKNENFTSIHIYEFVLVLKYTENGPEIISNESFNEKQKKKKCFKNGKIKLGEFVEQKDVLIGKMIPRNKKDFVPEEKLFKIVFSDNNFDYYEQPLLVPKNIYGNVIEIEDFRLYIFNNDVLKILKFEQIKKINKNMSNFFYEFLNYYIFKIKKKVINERIFLYKKKIKSKNLNINNLMKIKCINKNINCKIKLLKNIIILKYINIKNKIFYKKNDILRYEDFEKNIIRIIKIKIAMKKNVKIGDKLSGRHGNKGVVSIIEHQENMPYDKFGNSIEIILNPLGIPSRMNVGQLLEVLLGAVTKDILKLILKINKNKKNYIKKIKIFLILIFKFLFKKPINIRNIDKKYLLKIYNNIRNGINICIHNFENFNDQYFKKFINILGYSKTGKILLFDGFTGKRFLQLINVGYIYILKLNHLVIDKIYCRSIGPYSLITQQPLGGKSNLGGQRLGEMEVWAIEAYGAANMLREMLTVKSDDVIGRVKLYKNLINGIFHVESGIPESFQVLVKEIQALCFDIKTI